MYIPRSFSKSVWDEALGAYVTLTRDAMTPTEDVELRFDGWVAGTALPTIPVDSQIIAQVEQVVETGDFAPTGAWDFTGATVTGVTADAPVDSVNGKTGTVVLGASDVGASPAGHNHNGTYSPVGHNHDGTYSPVGHSHDGTYLAKTAEIQAVVKITQAAYDALAPKVATTLYVIAG